MDERRLTVIVVPHGDLETRTLELSYGRLKAMVLGAASLIVVFIVIVSTWWVVAAQAARVPGLEREILVLREKQAKVVQLERTVAEIEAQYEKVRQLLGADAPPSKGQEPILPPLQRDEKKSRERAGAGAEKADAWRLAKFGS